MTGPVIIRACPRLQLPGCWLAQLARSSRAKGDENLRMRDEIAVLQPGLGLRHCPAPDGSILATLAVFWWVSSSAAPDHRVSLSTGTWA